MLYPGEGEQKIHFACCPPRFISAQATNEVKLAISFVEMMPCQLKTKCFLLSVTAHDPCLECAYVYVQNESGKVYAVQGRKTFSM